MANQTKVKICGITNLADARYASGAMADYLGFIFYDKSPRFIDPAEAGAIINWIEGPEKVGVFVNQPLDDVNRIAKESGLDFVQLHGNETLEYCQLIEKPIIKVIHIIPEYNLEELKAKVLLYSEVAEFLLFDSKIDGQWGGTGKTFDWTIMKEIADGKSFFLSGGLNPENLKEAIETVQPYAVDISSGVEEEPGIKDYDKIEAVMDVVRN
ncbi:MAG: phosphoribosylanthranilate isomerase [Balneolaceae bacterium]